ncbi:MAG: hypothetical protein AAF828_03835 [Bacteroidota bacterium]
MKNLKHTSLLFLFFSLVAPNLQAQQKRKLSEQLYADVKYGTLFFHDVDAGSINEQITAGIGYRLSPRHGIGISYHRERVSGAYVGSGFRGIATDYRYANKNGLIFKVGGGLILTGERYEDFPNRYDYLDGGHFLDISIDHQWPIGLTFGVYLSAASGMQFAAYETADFSLSGTDEFTGNVSGEQGNFGISLGYAFPARRR